MTRIYIPVEAAAAERRHSLAQGGSPGKPKVEIFGAPEGRHTGSHTQERNQTDFQERTLIYA